PEQRVVVGRLEEIVQKAAEATLPSPATLVVGRVVRLSPLWTELARDAAPIPAGLRESGR
ncbi:MAG: uroporphyrinogen-III C-methyltransferase, partial [Armatimonadota bacterium]|nr:uroporphyrinogen-III C-methyltransferase [Armatimonadota bacterium]